MARKGGALPKTNKMLVRAAENERAALSLRKAGATYDAIARQLSMSEEGARAAVKRAVEKLHAAVNESARELRTMEVERCDAIQTALWSKVMKGDERASLVVLKVMERRARLLGLDAPETLQVQPGAGEREEHADHLGALEVGLERMAKDVVVEIMPGPVAPSPTLRAVPPIETTIDAALVS